MSATSTEPARPTPVLSFLAELLAEQQLLQTPVARFADAHAGPSPEARYSDLIPLSAPGPGEQYAFEVDLDSCTGCKACVTACHSLNGLDEHETWRDTGLLVSADPQHSFAQTVTSACHHCADPACLTGCPVLAYDKDPVTGIVRHLDDQCIGCNYCLLKCPYDVPKYNPKRGIVRKCDMCQGRLSAGEAPACAQACPTHAIRIVTVRTSVGADRRPRADTSAFLAAAPDPAYTQPTTRYLSRRGLPPDLVAADAGSLRPQPAHAPLVLLTTLMGGAVGCSAVAALAPRGASGIGAVLAAGWLAGLAGLVASVFHLGQPLRAWRVFLGLRRSWLSREAVVFAAWLAAATAALFAPGFVPVAALLGIAGLYCSAMVYVDTRREFWRLGQAATRFLGTAAILGLAAALAWIPASGPVALALAAATAAKLAYEWLAPRGNDRTTPAARQTGRLLAGPLRTLVRLRLGLGLAGGVGLPLLLAAGAAPAAAGRVALGLALLGELAERTLFFRAVAAPKMPGMGGA